MNRCTGHCCRKFHVLFTVQELRDDLEKEIPNWDPEEVKILIDMLIPIDVAAGFYTCRHFDTESGNCMNYEGRPPMCRDYPYGEACSFKDCTWDEAKNVPDRPVIKSDSLKVIT